MLKKIYTNQNAKVAMSTLTKKQACLWLLLLILFANTAYAQLIPEVGNIVRDVTELKDDLYEHIIPLGSKAPHFKLKDLDGKTYDTEDYFGKYVTIIYFWSSSCPYCRESLPKINKMFEELRGAGLRVLAVNVEGDLFQVAIKKFLKEGEITCPAPIDKMYKQTFFTAADPYGTDKTPTLFLVGLNEKVIYSAEVEIDYDKIRMLFLDELQTKKKAMVFNVLLISGGLLILAIIVYLFFIVRPRKIQGKLLDDLKRRTQDELNKQISGP